MKVSVLLLTIERYDLMRYCLEPAFREAGVPFDLCVTDNGSNDKRVFEWVEAQNPKLFIKNGMNKGTAQSLNKMIELNPSDFYVFIGNDIQLPQHWLRRLTEYLRTIPQSGVVGINWRPVTCEPLTINGLDIRKTERTFGTMAISQTLRNEIGKFCEDYGTYGMWDSDYSIRAELAGFINYYLPDMKSEHIGDDVNEKSDYRQMKNESLQRAKPIFEENLKKYKSGNYKII